MAEFTHFDGSGNAIMVDISEKQITERVAAAQGSIMVCRKIFDSIKEGSVKKGDVLGVARIAGIMGAKKTSELIPLCHPLMLTKCTVDFFLEDGEQPSVKAVCTVRTDGRTGVEMEALTGVQTALLTVYDMCKAIDKGMVITDVHLLEKSGGKSGDFSWQ